MFDQSCILFLLSVCLLSFLKSQNAMAAPPLKGRAALQKLLSTWCRLCHPGRDNPRSLNLRRRDLVSPSFSRERCFLSASLDLSFSLLLALTGGLCQFPHVTAAIRASSAPALAETWWHRRSNRPALFLWLWSFSSVPSRTWACGCCSNCCRYFITTKRRGRYLLVRR